ncbi:MAG TPA: hypothetical protein VLR26_04415 [Frankiaceae bacterium]|nr:hypothetical protein [Frankiaceae bacterium]
MSTIPLDLPGAVVAAVPIEDQGSEQSTGNTARRRLRRAPAVLAPTLPALLMFGLCIAGMSDPPDQPAGGSAVSSRLHVPTEDPSLLPSVPRRR